MKIHMIEYIELFWLSMHLIDEITKGYFWNYFVNASSQWETTLHCNVVSHWLGAFTKWSLVFGYFLWGVMITYPCHKYMFVEHILFRVTCFLFPMKIWVVWFLSARGPASHIVVNHIRSGWQLSSQMLNSLVPGNMVYVTLVTSTRIIILVPHLYIKSL